MSKKLLVPVPESINPLTNNGFNLSISKLPHMRYFCQEASIPSIDAQSAMQDTPLVNNYIPGDKLDFGNLDVSFMIDENMKNYLAIQAWIIGLGFPVSHSQYRNFVDSNRTALVPSEILAGYSDVVLDILSPFNKTIQTIHFVDAFPVALGSVQMTSTLTDTTYVVGTCTFRYTYYLFK